MKYLGIDYGENNLGLAVSNGILAEPYQEFKDQRSKIKTKVQKLKLIKDIFLKEGIEKIVLGLPENQMADNVKEFGSELKKIINLPVEYQDETLTSQDAVKKMIESGRGRQYRKTNQHHIAACLILQSYLDRLSFEG